MAAPTHGYVPGLAGMLVQMYGRTELCRNSNMFFSASIHNLTVIKDPLQNPQTKRENPNIQSRGKSKRVKTLLVVLIRGGSKEGEEIEIFPLLGVSLVTFCTSRK